MGLLDTLKNLFGGGIADASPQPMEDVPTQEAPEPQQPEVPAETTPDEGLVEGEDVTGEGTSTM